MSNFTKPLNTISIQGLRAAMEALTMNQKPAKTPEEALNKSYQFWNTQPVPKMGKPRTQPLLFYNPTFR